MPGLDDHIEPGERVIWRTQSLRGEAKRTAAWFAGLAAFATASAIWFDEGFPYLIAAILAVIFFVHWGRRPAEAWITGRRVLFMRGVLRPRISTVDRSDVIRVELFDGDDTLVLHGANGELYRAPLLEAPDNLLDELGLSITFWRDRVESHLSNFTHLAVIFALLSMVLVIVAALVGMIAFGGPDSIRSALRDVSPLAGAWYGALSIAAVISVIPLGTFIGLAVISVMRRIALTQDEMTVFRRAVRYPVWAGYDPRSPLYTNWLYRSYRMARLVLDRVLYGRPPDRGTIEPDIVAPCDLDKFRD